MTQQGTLSWMYAHAGARLTVPLALALTALAVGCSESTPESPAIEAGPAWFRDEALERGLEFVQRSGATGEFLMPEIMCGGAALFDMEGDGDLDAYCVQAADGSPAGNRLYENDGNGRFSDVTVARGAGAVGYGNGVTVGDFDGDGDEDLYVTNAGPNVLLANDGSGHFTDVTQASGVGDAAWGTSSAFVDYDSDGDLDLYVCNYLVWQRTEELECFNTMGGRDYCNPRNYQAPAVDVFYRNEGGGRFVDASAEVGITGAPGTGLGVVVADFNVDGRPDLFVANDGMPDRLWINEGGQRFVDSAREFGCALDQNGRAAAGMGVVAGDVDRDGDPDLLVCNLRNEPDSFFRNDAGVAFSNRTARVGLASTSRRFTRFGMGWCDFDSDGYVDLYQANGRVMRQRDEYGDDAYAEPNLLFRGSATGGFAEVEPRGGTATLAIGASRAAAFGDVDNDGGVDVLIVNRDGPAHLLMNVAPARGNWIGFDLRMPGVALGARVEVQRGEIATHHVVQVAGSYQAANDPRVHVGLGEHDAVELVRVTWPDGTQEDFGPFAAGGVRKLLRGSGR